MSPVSPDEDSVNPHLPPRSSTKQHDRDKNRGRELDCPVLSPRLILSEDRPSFERFGPQSRLTTFVSTFAPPRERQESAASPSQLRWCNTSSARQNRRVMAHNTWSPAELHPHSPLGHARWSGRSVDVTSVRAGAVIKKRKSSQSPGK